MDRRDRPEWKWKLWAIDRAAEMLREAVPQLWIERVTFVPVPPSKTKDHPEYDSRLVEILHRFEAGRHLDVRELVLMTDSVDAAHLSEDPRSVQNLVRRMKLDSSLTTPRPNAICVFDDVLTTGAHFKAVQAFLRTEFPTVPLAGLFLARRAPEAGPI